MGWTATYQILRDRPLDDDELTALDDYVAKHNRPSWECESFRLAVTRAARADRVLGHGWQKLPMNLDESEDHQRLCDVLTGLQDVIAGIEVRIDDDFDAFGWDDERRAVTLQDAPGPAPVDLPSADRDGFVAPAALLAPRPAAPDPAADGLAAMPASARAIAGLDTYDDHRNQPSWESIERAMQEVVAGGDVAALVPGFLAVWAAPRGVYWYGDMCFGDAVRDALAGTPEVEARMLADVAAGIAGTDSEIAHRRAEHAAAMLARATSGTAARALLEGVAALRDTTMTTDQRYHTYEGLIAGLARVATADAVPTLALALDNAGSFTRAQRAAVDALMRLAPARVPTPWGSRIDDATAAALRAEEQAILAALRG